MTECSNSDDIGGGNENDLIELGSAVFPGTKLLGIKGNVLENGMPRFFKRIAMGVFDIENYHIETDILKNFIDEMVDMYALNKNKLWVLGYSNGANIATNLLVKNPSFFKGVALLHAMPIDKIEPLSNKQNTKVLLTSGINDPIIPFLESQKLEKSLKEIVTDFQSKIYSFGHSLSEKEVSNIKEWFQTNSL